MKVFAVLALLAAIIAPSVSATDHAVEMTCYGWDPPSLTIQTGDRVFFWNGCPGNSIIVSHMTGPCAPWSTPMIVWNSWAVVTFNCGPGTETYIESSGWFGYTGSIVITAVGPTPTPNTTPATGPVGAGLLLVIMGGLLAVPAWRRRR